MAPFSQQAHIVTIGVPDPYLDGFRKGGLPYLKTRAYPNFPIFELYECTHPSGGIIEVRTLTKLVVLELMTGSSQPRIPFPRQVEQIHRVFPAARVWCLTDEECDLSASTYEVGEDLDADLANKVIGFTPYVDETGNVLEPMPFYRKALNLAFPDKFSY